MDEAFIENLKMKINVENKTRIESTDKSDKTN